MLLIYNRIRSIPEPAWNHGGLKYLEHTDGGVTEHFGAFGSATPDMMALDIARMQEAAQPGAIMIFKDWPGFNWLDTEMMDRPVDELSAIAADEITFPLASFLIVAERNFYFNYTWGYHSHHGALDWYPEFDRPLGPPLGAALQEGWIYSREFAHASVSVDLEDKSAKIDWHETEAVP